VVANASARLAHGLDELPPMNPNDQDYHPKTNKMKNHESQISEADHFAEIHPLSENLRPIVCAIAPHSPLGGTAIT